MNNRTTPEFLAALELAEELLPDLIRVRDRLAEWSRRSEWWSNSGYLLMSDAVLGTELAADALARFTRERPLIGQVLRDPEDHPPAELTAGP